MGNGVETDEQRRAKDAEEVTHTSPVVALRCDNERRNQKFAKKPQAGLHRHPDIDDDDGPMRGDERLTRTGAGEKHMAHVVEVCAECF